MQLLSTLLSDCVIHVDCRRPTLGLSRAPVDTDAYKYLQSVWTAIICHKYKEQSCILFIIVNSWKHRTKIVTASSYVVNVLVLLQTRVERETAAQV